MHTDNRNIRITAISLIVLLMVAATTLTSGAGEMDAWGQLSLSQRQKAAEAIGEDGARLFAEKRGWRPLYDSHTPDCISQGLDLVYIDPATGRTKVIEAKGGNASVRQSYGYRQGTPEWAVKSSERVLKSSRASAAQQAAARAVIESASAGKLDVLTINTPHMRGVPKDPIVKTDFPVNPGAARMAREVSKALKLPHARDIESKLKVSIVMQLAISA